MIGNYRILRKVGSGGMGSVYEAVHIYLRRRCAIKLLHPEFASNPQAVARFLREAQVANRPRCKGVVVVEDAGSTTDGSIFLLMEYLDGEALSERIARIFALPVAAEGEAPPDSPTAAPPPPASHYIAGALRLARQLASTLDAIHKSGVVHRDLKPDNIFIVIDPESFGGERIKILDFGIAKVIAHLTQHNEGTRSWAPTLQRTAVGTVLGTPSYMGPEQWRGEGNITDRADVYAFGAILFEMLSGRPPFTAQVIGDLIEQHLTQAPPLLSEVAPWAPAGLNPLIGQMLKKNPIERPSMATIEKQLEALLAASPPVVDPRLQNFAASWIYNTEPVLAKETFRLQRVSDESTGEIANFFRKPGKLGRWTIRGGAAACASMLMGLIILLFQPPPQPPISAWDWLIPRPTEWVEWTLRDIPQNAFVYQSSPQYVGDPREPLERVLKPITCGRPCRIKGLAQVPPKLIIRAPKRRSMKLELDPAVTNVSVTRKPRGSK